MVDLQVFSVAREWHCRQVHEERRLALLVPIIGPRGSDATGKALLLQLRRRSLRELPDQGLSLLDLLLWSTCWEPQAILHVLTTIRAGRIQCYIRINGCNVTLTILSWPNAFEGRPCAPTLHCCNGRRMSRVDYSAAERRHDPRISCNTNGTQTLENPIRSR